MSFGSSDGGAAAMRAQQQHQQRLTDQGIKQIQAIFQGGTYGVGPTSYTGPGQAYYNAAGSPLTFNAKDPDFLAWLGDTRKSINPPIRATTSYTMDQRGVKTPTVTKVPRTPEEIAKYQQGLWQQYLSSGAAKNREGLFAGTQTSPGFGPDFYKGIQQTYQDYAMPQVENQYQTAANQMLYRLADQGITQGTGAQYLGGQLQKTMADATNQVTQQGVGLAQQKQQDVTQQENALINQLIASGNPGLTTQQALSQASQFRAPSAFPAVGNLFNTFANTYLTAGQQAAYNPYVSNPYSSIYRAPSQSTGSSYSYVQ